ncbi:MAG: hypothetical protein KJO41_11340 [Bacteroidia bacterium]|nr:hypothetical protein [Bacteroidia bacterium]NND25290.1 hypothetical protein [Flavobacteriaceae bacterium]NNK59310.1 hypothetical protein [Flavobacteriaceae bacterium]NNL34011.1 hypothetical protein [Flavobacteriaceae bacterium]RZW56086.1 MAG: hypothetical protein EX263_02865 [Flavobacteriaceae bacterium]
MRIFKSMVMITLLFLFLASCKSNNKETPTAEEPSEVLTKNFIDVLAKDYTFTVADSIPSGWSTFRMKNTGMMDHFFLLTKLPDTVNIDHYNRDVGGAFGIAWNAIRDGKSKDEAFGLLGENLPEWYGSAVAMGGAGLISPGEVAINTMKLEPGYYVMECYIKAENGQFHTELGMITPLIVTDEQIDNVPPEADVKLTLTNEAMQIEGEITSGKTIFAVHYKEQPPFGLGNDIHIVKVDETTNLDEVAQWMDWSNLTGMVSPGAPAKFIGGSQEMPAGYTAYFECDLAPGAYAFMAEIPIGRYEAFKVN